MSSIPTVLVLGEGRAGRGGAIAGPVAAARREAQQWLGEPETGAADAAPDVARRLRDRGASAVCIVGGTDDDGRALHWLDTRHARGWIAPAAPGAAADALRFAGEWQAALARGFVAADAALIATMALAGDGRPGFINEPHLLPRLSWADAPRFAAPVPAPVPHRLGLYAIVDSADRVQQVLAAGVKTVQLRIKAPPAPDDSWRAALRREVERSIAACRANGAQLYVNDHWQLAAELGAFGVHLGQEDLAAMSEERRAALLASGLALGVSSHSLWELARAAALAPRYIACGPVWPTLTKDMPWRPQGLDNLAWWCRMASVPVVAIGGILAPRQVQDAARCGADGVCIVRGLGERPQDTVPPLQAALEAGRREHAADPPAAAWPHPSLAATAY
ncbi:thiamine phosphate synthase [Ramlibacter sp. RBP-2]|uniref:Thiamine phosphate synthase n=1 Tax=Ramlibacter lithotrophicus TaxID=2606681 RepID=A0A7X6DEA2_9BURK|nr:thiamine phosphate synthase [Ramlibacter lithotrophicus]